MQVDCRVRRGEPLNFRQDCQVRHHWAGRGSGVRGASTAAQREVPGFGVREGRTS